MSFRARLALVAAAAVALAVVVASAVVFVVVADSCSGRSTQSLRRPRDRASQHGPAGLRIDGRLSRRARVRASACARTSSSSFRRRRAPCSRRTSRVALPGRPSGARDVATGAAAQYFSDAHVRGHRLPRAHRSRCAAGHRAPGRAAARPRSTTRCRRITLLPVPDRGRRGRCRGRARARSSRSAALAPVRRLTEATERVTETGDLSERIEIERPRRAQPARGELQHDARRARGVEPRAAAARRRRLARAAHAADEPAHEHRGARAASGRFRRSERERLLGDVVEQLGEMTTLIAELIELARARAARRASPRTSGSTCSPPTPSSARGGTGPRSPSRPTSRSRWSTAPRRRSSARSRTCSTTRPSGARRAARSRSASTAARSRCATTARGSPRRTCRTCSTASTARRPPAGMPGSGLGLAIVQQVAEAHGGHVAAEPAEGGGTLMRLTLDGKV